MVLLPTSESSTASSANTALNSSIKPPINATPFHFSPDSLAQSAADGESKTKLCGTCGALGILAKFEEPKLHKVLQCVPRWDMATLRGQANCPLCRLLRKTLDNCTAIHLDTVDLIWGRFEGRCSPSPDTWPPRRLRLFVDVKSEQGFVTTKDINRCLQINSKNYSQATDNNFVHARQISPDKVDASLVVKWLRQCEQMHHLCQPLTTDALTKFRFRVIDVLSGCIIEAPPNCSFIALSYVWGGVQQRSISRTRMEVFRYSGSLWAVKRVISTTIMDAITFCRLINQRYLWVDSLCIVSDDSDKHRQILHMDAIYACAILTIVDAAGTGADGGLFGVRGRLRKSAQEEEEILGLPMISAIASMGDLLDDSTWITRGWTFQEYLLSKRLLIFTQRLAFFKCR